MFVFDFPIGWYLLLLFAVVLFAVFSYVRKSFSGVIKFGLIVLVVSAFTEAIAVAMNLWNYTGGNWPVILWPIYFIFAAAFYQIFKVLDR